MTDRSLIRNFSIIAHIDHGKSTLADRFLVPAGPSASGDARPVPGRHGPGTRDGITIKAHRATIEYKADDGQIYIAQPAGHAGTWISTTKCRGPGRLRGCAAAGRCHTGAQAQTIANAHMAMAGNKIIIR